MTMRRGVKQSGKKTLGGASPQTNGPSERGFTLIEMTIVLLVLSILTAGALSLCVDVQRSVSYNAGAAGLLDVGHTATHQMCREIRLAGYPGPAAFTSAAVAAHPGIVADSFTTATGYDLVFEGDLNGNGVVEKVEYVLNSGSTTLLRIQTLKNANGTYATSSTVSQSFLSNVQNQVTGQPIFTWLTNPGSTKPFPGNIQTVFINLQLKSRSPANLGVSSLTLQATSEVMNP